MIAKHNTRKHFDTPRCRADLLKPVTRGSLPPVKLEAIVHSPGNCEEAEVAFFRTACALWGRVSSVVVQFVAQQKQRLRATLGHAA